jgi:subtilase family serine protease
LAAFEVITEGGGTSLATPMLTGLWAIANEYYDQSVAKNPSASLGLAAPYVYWAQTNFPSAITDIQQGSYSKGANHNVTGCEHRLFHYGCHPHYSDSYLVNAPQGFVSALMDDGIGNWYVISFGTDSSLVTAPGWDNVTGVGVPNGLQFLLGINQYR